MATLTHIGPRRRLQSLGDAGSLPPELQDRLPGRLRLAATAVIVGYLMLLAFRTAAETPGLPFDIAVACAAFGLSVAAIVVSRREQIPPAFIITYYVATSVCMGLSTAGPYSRVEQWADLWGISWLTTWIAAYLFIVPCVPRRAEIGAVVSAIAAPLTIVAWAAISGVQLPPAQTFIFATVPNAVGAALGVYANRLLFRLAAALEQVRRMGAYSLERILGQGGMGEVWLASHQLLARPAAIKLIRHEKIGDGLNADAILQRFEREAQVTATLKSPHTVQVYDFGLTDDNSFYYVMELLDGIDLETLVQRYGPLLPERAVYITMQICHSLHEAHSHGLVHRDIKPANILVCRYATEFDFTKVLDFGLVKAVDQEDAPAPADTSELACLDTDVSVAGVFLGTVAFCCPEAVTGGEQDARSDIYSLACVLFWMLTGELVFQDTEASKTLMAHLKHRPPTISEVGPRDVSDDLEKIMAACLSKSPDDRPQSAQDLRRRLQQLTFDKPWTEERAETWWMVHNPAPPGDEPPLHITLPTSVSGQ